MNPNTSEKFRMGGGSNMSATEMPTGGLQTYKRTRQSAILLACAGLIVIAGACTEIIMWAGIVVRDADASTWGSDIYTLLGMMFIAMVLSVAGIARLPQEETGGDPVRSGIVVRDADASTWGSDIYTLLGMMFIAMVLSVAGIARLPQEETGGDPVRGGTRKSWLILAMLILIHCYLALSYNKQVRGDTIDTYTFQRDACRSLLQGIRSEERR